MSQVEYEIASRRIAGTREERLAQIEDAIQELLDLKRLECAADSPGMRFIAAPRRSHWAVMTAVTLVLLLVLMLLGVA